MFGIFKIIIFWIAGIFFLSAIGGLALPKIANSGIGAQSQTQNFSYWLSLAQWDGGNYVEIATSGYSSPRQFAFSPLYPFFMRTFTQIFRVSPISSGIAISIVSFFAFIYVFHRYSVEIYGGKKASDIILTFLFFPTTFFCITVYSESLFLLLAITSIYALSRNKHMLFAASTALLPFARYIGIFLILGNIFKGAVRAKNKITIAAIFLSPAPFLVYTGYLYLTFGNALLFMSVQSGWGRFAIDPVTTIFSSAISLISLQAFSLNNVFDISTAAAFLYLLARNAKRVESNVWIFSILAILVPLSTGTLTSIPRYALASLGTFIIIGTLLNTRPRVKHIIWALSLSLQSLLVALFITGHWVA